MAEPRPFCQRDSLQGLLLSPEKELQRSWAALEKVPFPLPFPLSPELLHLSPTLPAGLDSHSLGEAPVLRPPSIEAARGLRTPRVRRKGWG